MLNLPLKRQRGSGNVYICCAKSFRFSSHHGDFRFGSNACMFQFMGQLFLYFFKSFPTFGFASVYFAAKMAAAKGLVETK